MVSAEGIESALKSKLNNLQRQQTPDLPSFRRSAPRTACNRHGLDGPFLFVVSADHSRRWPGASLV